MNQPLSHTAPAPFNPEYREGLYIAVSKAHSIWCDANPNVSRKVRAEAYLATHNRLRPQFPSVAELRDTSN